jgi:hypothetical protein
MIIVVSCNLYLLHMRMLLVKWLMGIRQLFFSVTIRLCNKESQLLLFIGTSLTTQFDKYLGLPAILGRSKRRAFREVKERIWRRLQGWKEKLLSQSGREVLIKAVDLGYSHLCNELFHVSSWVVCGD